MTASARKYALVTGASRGIGKEIALRLARDGTFVFVHFGKADRQARAVSDHINANGGHATVLQADFADIGAPGRLADAVATGIARDGGSGLDILINNAGIGTTGLIADTTEQAYDSLFDINLKAMFFLTKALLGTLKDGGRIINISSTVSMSAYPSCIAYAMCKAGVNSFTRSLAQELGPRGITVNAVAPGITATELLGDLLRVESVAQAFISTTALGRLGSPPDIASVVGFLASPEAGWVTGQVLPVCGGSHL